MEQNSRNYNTNGLIKKVVSIAVAVLVALGGLIWHFGICWADDGTTTMWIMCQPGDYVHARSGPSTKRESLGRLETGDHVEVDGRTKHGFAHVQELGLEESDGWIYAGYLIDEEPRDARGMVYTVTANGRVACRKCIDGERRCWVVDGSQVKVYWYTSEWAVTNKGFIMTMYLEGLDDASIGEKGERSCFAQAA